ncbi:hypothetical protein WDS03_001370 [Campylobacter upsaliensis]|nr:hypothetical protein [Campylobacter upsaliensis]EAH5904177.1 hypothetical protein [Campylobacter upsaliensis]EAI2137198.1 hypothetical protein [Campylobacter upsaliensis]EAI7238630.1 hypothetical protein [Campylobacter upsaliensis]EAJ0467065.1 hypothetical protein [Campylobacter upsaliensis]
MKLKDFDFRIHDKEKARDYIYHFDPKKFMEKMLIDTSLYETLGLELWSGVCDKRGFRIYEGDIIECEAKIAGLYKKVRGSVTFKDGCFYVLVDNNIYKLNTLLNIKLLGNIHEKKELLKD